MSILKELIETSGDEVKELVKTHLLELLQEAQSDTEDMVKETAKKIEKWIELKVNEEIDADELEALLSTRRRTVRQFLNTQEITVKVRLEKLTTGLIDLVLNKALDIII